jgi:DNA processing protein
MSVDAEEMRARVALSRLAEPANPALARTLRLVSPAELLDQLLSQSLDDHVLDRQLRSRLERLDIDKELAALDSVGGRVVCPGDDEWPVCLDDLDDRAPLVLYVRGGGHLAAAVDRAVAMVGTRDATAYGVEVATTMSVELSDRGWTIVSGGAYGIDAASHRGALAAGGVTVAVLACGVDVTYPRGHDGLFEAIAESGLIVSELPPGSAPHRMRFLDRNRLIAALAAGTVVVEAAARSGARRTALDALALGRSLMIVPGSVIASSSVGCHRLLREKPEAVLVTGAADVCEQVGRIGADLAPVPQGATTSRDALTAELARVLDAVPVYREQGPARIAATAGLPLRDVELALGRLEMVGLVEQRAGHWRLSAAQRRARSSADSPRSASDGHTRVSPGA